MDETRRKARALGMNHVALEVGNIEQALAFYGSIFEFELRGRGARMAFIDLGDQFLALSEGRTQGADEDRHLGLVVDDKAAGPCAPCGTGSGAACWLWGRVPRPMGQPRSDRRVPRDPVHQGAARASGDGPCRTGEVVGGYPRAS